MKNILWSLLLCLSTGSVSYAAYSSVSFYVVAHPDDWELFMGVNAYRDIQASSTYKDKKVVLIYLSAAETNCSGHGVDTGYYLSRQVGTENALQFCSDIYSPHDTCWNRSGAIIHGATSHKILRSQYKDVVSYYLRLPDGCFELTPLSMKKFMDGALDSLAAVDHSATYHSPEDLVLTIRDIMRTESHNIGSILVNTSDWDESINPADHPDHVQAGLLAAEAAQTFPCIDLVLFEGYGTCIKPVNLTPDEIAIESGLLSEISFVKTLLGFGTEWDPANTCGHLSWVSKNYFRRYSSCDTNSSKNNTLEVFPNPSAGLLNLKYSVAAKGMVNIMLFDTYGNIQRKIVSEYKDKGSYSLVCNISQIKDGNYIIYLSTPGSIKSTKFVKQ